MLLHKLAAVLRIQTLLIRIQILLFTLILIQILLFNFIRIQIQLFDRFRSFLFQRGNVPKTVLFIHLHLIFLVSRFNRTQPKGIPVPTLLNFPFQLIFLCLLE
jgi:hypothetical protein